MFQVFLESILFLKSENFKNSFLPCFGDSVVGKSSRRPQSPVRGSILATCSRVEGPVARVTQRFSQLSSRLSREQTFQSRKTLRNFFQNFVFECFGGLTWRLVGDSFKSRKSRVLQNELIFNIFLKNGFSFAYLALCVCSFSDLTFTYASSLWESSNSFNNLLPFNLSSRKGMGFVIYSLFCLFLMFLCSPWYSYFSYLCLIT